MSLVNPCRSTQPPAGGMRGVAQQRRPQQRSLFVVFFLSGLFIFLVMTLVVYSLESLVEPPPMASAARLLALAPTHAGPPLAIVEEEKPTMERTRSPTAGQTMAEPGAQDDFAKSLGAVAFMLTSTHSPTAPPARADFALSGGAAASGAGEADAPLPPQTTEYDKDDARDDAVPDPPRPDDDGDEGEVIVTPAQLANEPRVNIAKGLHACTYGLSEKTGGLSMSTWIWRFRKSAVGHDEYAKTPGSYRVSKLKAAVKQALSGDWKRAPVTAALAGFTLCKVDLVSQIVVAWQPRVRGDVLLFTRHGRNVSNAVLEIPHPQYDHTLVQGLHVFQETRARALLLSTSHRCAKALANKCTGNDGEPIRSNCASRASYHNSDAAHATQTLFMAVHEELADVLATDVFVSLHATKLEDFVVSDGTSREASRLVVNKAVVVASQLALLVPQVKVGLCNPFEPASSTAPVNLVRVAEDASHVCGATNVQGRHLNGAKDPCKAKVSRSGAELEPSNRFVHIEQPVVLVKPESAKALKPPMSRPLSMAILAVTVSGNTP